MGKVNSGQNKKTDRKRDPRFDNITQLIAGLVIVVLLNIIGTYVFTRLDLTSEKRYTLSQSTKKLLRETDDIIYFKVYLEGDLPAEFKRLSRSTREMLDEFRAYSDNIQYEFINPLASEDAKARKDIQDRLTEQGLTPTDIAVRTKDGQKQQSIFPGALVTYKGKTIPVSLLANKMGAAPKDIINNSIQALEYNILSSVRKLSTVNKPRIAFTQGHGEFSRLETADIAIALSDYYTVEYVDLKGNVNAFTERSETEPGKFHIRNKFEALVIAGPDSTFNEKDKFIIDQFVMRGGKILWLIDPVFATMDSLQKTNMTIGVTRDINLNDLLFKYGVRLNSNLLMDLAALPIPMVTGMVGNQPQFEFFPWPYFPVLTATSSHPVVKNINAIRTEFISSIDTVGDPSIRKTVLLKTSKYTRIAQTPVMISLEILGRDPDTKMYADPPQPVAVLLEGKFSSVFNNRIPKEISEAPEIGFTPQNEQNNKMIVISDGDMIRNQVQFNQGNYMPLPLGYDRHTGQTFGNKELMLNAMNYLCDDSGLMAVRSRELKLRALDVNKARENLLGWQLFNILLPVVLVVIFGIIQFTLRKRRYSR
ncbi:MAG TPA: gliding motility-associated ABC transporter substrate-binding protein GldG [Lentimicrobium sp.]|nr:gliding motility-associated ABC transporter substrate-binding protein GldG [Lentimicrobium sp.]